MLQLDRRVTDVGGVRLLFGLFALLPLERQKANTQKKKKIEKCKSPAGIYGIYIIIIEWNYASGSA